MKKNSRIIILAAIGLICLLFLLTRRNKSNEAQKFIDNIKSENKYALDSLQSSFNMQNRIYSQIEKNITDNKLDEANKLIDSVYLIGERHMSHVYRGMLFSKKDDYDKAMDEYNIAISMEKNSIAYAKRAELYVKLNKLNYAMSDYKYLYSINYDYSLDIAKIYDHMKKRDSALFYYLQYLRHYPNDTNVIKKVDFLNKSK